MILSTKCLTFVDKDHCKGHLITRAIVTSCKNYSAFFSAQFKSTCTIKKDKQILHKITNNKYKINTHIYFNKHKHENYKEIIRLFDIKSFNFPWTIQLQYCLTNAQDKYF